MLEILGCKKQLEILEPGYYLSDTLGATGFCPMPSSATTLKISPQLKRRVAVAAKAADKSAHAFMLEAIERQTRLDEQRRSFLADALVAQAEAYSSGQGYRAHEVHQYIGARVRGERAKRPKLRAWHK